MTASTAPDWMTTLTNQLMRIQPFFRDQQMARGRNRRNSVISLDDPNMTLMNQASIVRGENPRRDKEEKSSGAKAGASADLQLPC